MNTKTMKILVTVATILMTVVFLSTTCFAVDPSSIIDGMQNQKGDTDTGALTGLGGSLLNILQILGIIVGTIILVVLGLKYMTGSLEEKAEYKKTMIPYIVGAVIVFAGPSLAKGIFAMISTL